MPIEIAMAMAIAVVMVIVGVRQNRSCMAVLLGVIAMWGKPSDHDIPE